MYPDYTKQEQWSAAVVKETPTISPSTYYTRTIPQLVNVPMDAPVWRGGSAMVAGVKQGENGDVVIPLTGGRYTVAIVRSSN
jgi:hypothetical protein